MTLRKVKCDFCSRELTGDGWRFPASDFDYPELRTGPGLPPGAFMGGSVGEWLSCRACAALVRAGRREHLVRRSAKNFRRLYPGLIESIGEAVVLANIRDAHDRFWSHREGPGHWIDRGYIERAAREPAFVEEPGRAS